MAIKIFCDLCECEREIAQVKGVEVVGSGLALTVPTMTSGHFVCDVWGEDDDATDANGRLIEAAPSMKNVLEHYLMLLKQANAGDAVAECKLYEDMMLIEDVLQKVEGE